MKHTAGFWPYRFFRFVLAVVLKVCNRYTVSGREHVPQEGACIIVANHVSFLDPPMLGIAVSHRVLQFVARDTLFAAPVFGRLMAWVKCVPIRRSTGDIAAIRAVLKILKEERAVGIFPEGTRSPDGRLRPAKPGIGLLIAKAGVPVVPACIEGTYAALPKGRAWLRPHKIHVTFGPAIPVTELQVKGRDREAYTRIGERVMERIAALQRPADGGRLSA